MVPCSMFEHATLQDDSPSRLVARAVRRPLAVRTEQLMFIFDKHEHNQWERRSRSSY